MTGFLDPSLDCDQSVLQHVKSSQLVPTKKITKHANLLYLYIYEKDFEKARETSEMGPIF